MTIDIQCTDFLSENRHWYATKSRRKKIAFVEIEVTNRFSSAARLFLGSSILTSGGRKFEAESPRVIIRKLSEFTWDFLLFAILDLNPIISLIEASVFLAGPLYNRRLKRKLSHLSNGEMSVAPGESKTVLVGFRRVSKSLERIEIPYRCGDEDAQMIQFVFIGK